MVARNHSNNLNESITMIAFFSDLNGNRFRSFRIFLIMKVKKILFLIVASGSFVFLSCGEKKDPADSPSDGGDDKNSSLTSTTPGDDDASTDSSDAPAPPVPEVSVDKMTISAGFAAFAPKNTEGYFSVRGAYDMYERLQKSELGKLFLKTLSEQGMDLAEVEQSEEFQMVKSVIGEELFAVFGDTSGDQLLNLNTLSKSINYYQMKMLVEMIAGEISGEEPEGELQAIFMSMFSEILKDPKGGIDLLEKFEMPPLLLGFKVSDQEMRDQLSEMIAGGIGEMLKTGDDAAFPEIDTEVSGVKLTGVKIDGARVAALADGEAREEMTEMLGDKKTVDRLLKGVATKNLFITTGVKDDYVLIYLGGSMEGFKLAATPADSLVANSEMEFLKRYADKDVRFLLFVEKDASVKVGASNEAFASMARGLKDGLAESDAFGDTRDLQTLLGDVAKLDKELFGMIKYGRTGVVGFLEDGFKIESHSGINVPSADLNVPHTFTALGEMDDVVLYANSVSNPVFNEKVFDMLDSLGEASYLMASQVAEMDIDDNDFREFQEGFGVFDSDLKKDLTDIWKAVSSDWADGTGNEGALVIDLKGTLPKIPGVPAPIIEKGLMPRIAYITPIKDREKLTGSWTRIEDALTNLLKAASKLGAPEIPMQEIDENNKDGITTFSTAIQFSTKDARPVVSLSDEHFYISSSQKLVVEIDAALKAGKGPARKGSYGVINFSAVQKLATHWVDLVKANADTIFEDSEFAKDDFMENVPMIESAIKAFGELDDLTWHVRSEGGEVRTSIHFDLN